jgi:outer membrane protein OmpA-like peptidoglycan-associated protein
MATRWTSRRKSQAEHPERLSLEQRNRRDVPFRALFGLTRRHRDNAATNLNALAHNPNKYDGSNLMIIGHTDDVGTATYNQGLSDRRAQSAARYLTGQGVPSYIATAGLGEREPLASNDTEAGRHENRRVEVAIYASAATQEEARRQASSH